jgi:sulfur carrier protein ThiS
MGKVLIRFYEELNDYLPPGKRKRDFEVPLNGNETVRQIVGRLGVPPAQVDLLLVNGQSVSLEEVVNQGDRISVYPVFESLDIEEVSRVREKPLRSLRFIADADLKTLAQALERLGLDVFSREGLGREEILQAAKEERRVLLTLQSDLEGSQELERMIVLRPGSLHEQIHQVIDALDLRVDVGEERAHEGKE